MVSTATKPTRKAATAKKAESGRKHKKQTVPQTASKPRRPTPPPPFHRAHTRPSAPVPKAQPAPTATGPPLASTPPPEPAARPRTQAEELQEIVRRASGGDEASLAALRRVLDHHPEIWMTVGNVSSLAERAWVDLLSSNSLLAAESLSRNLRRLKAGLAGPSPTPTETMLVDMIGVRFLAAQHAEYTAAQQGGSLEQARFRLRRAESAQKRFTSSLKMLTLVRSLAPRSLMLLSSASVPSEPISAPLACPDNVPTTIGLTQEGKDCPA
jgi:hypothetical protein